MVRLQAASVGQADIAVALVAFTAYMIRRAREDFRNAERLAFEAESQRRSLRIPAGGLALAVGAVGGGRVTALYHPLAVSSALLNSDMVWMMGVALALFPVMWTGRTVSRSEGALLLAMYGDYLFMLLR